MKNQYGITEFADGLGDLVELLDDDGIRSAFEKGSNFEFLKLLIKGADAYPKIKEIIDDAPTFFKEAGDLVPAEKQQVMNILYARFPNPDQLQGKILEIYDTAGFAFVWVFEDVYGKANELVNRVKHLFGNAGGEEV